MTNRTEYEKRKEVDTDKKKVRKCLMCGDEFLSRGPQWRRCGECEEKVKRNEDSWWFEMTEY